MAEAKGWKEFFSRVRYKPGFTIDYNYMIDFDQHRVILTMKVCDSRDPQAHMDPNNLPLEGRRIRLIPVTSSHVLPHWYGERHAKDYLHHLLLELERHELDEWFSYDDELVSDPHAHERKSA